MSKGMIGCGVLLAIALALVATGVGSYNRLIELEEGVTGTIVDSGDEEQQ